MTKDEFSALGVVNGVLSLKRIIRIEICARDVEKHRITFFKNKTHVCVIHRLLSNQAEGVQCINII